MSLILGYANRGHAIIVSDGRAGVNGSYSEHYNKTKKINENIILGFAGYLEPIEHFLKHVINQMGAEINDYFIDDFWDLLEFLMKFPDTQEHLQSSFIVIGKTKNNELYTSIIGDNTNYKFEKNLVLDTPRILSIGGTIDSSIINNIYMNNILQFDRDICDCMISTVHEVAELDSSVNKNCFAVVI